MEIKKLKCPECGANFENDAKVSFCSYCGTKLYFDDGTKNINYKTEDVARIKEIEANKELELNKRQEEHKQGKKAFWIMALCFIMVFGMIFVMSASGRAKSDSQEKELQSIVNEIYIDISAGNYDMALIKTKSLHYTEGWSSDIEEKWDDIREALEKIIKEKKK